MIRFFRGHLGTQTASLIALAMGLSACQARFDDQEAKHAAASPCEPIMFESSRFTLCTAQPGTHSIGTDLAPPDKNEPFGSFAQYAQLEHKSASRTAMAINGGMFDSDQQPIGYFVEEGRRLTVINESGNGDEAASPGNFHLKPNGVFFGDKNGPWHVRETVQFVAQSIDRPTFATQSGPMLVIDGHLHPKIAVNGDSRHIRNGVGVDASGRALFVISEDKVSLGRLARLYRDVLNAENALYLDGAISQLWDPANGRMDEGAALGPLIVVQNRAEAGS